MDELYKIYGELMVKQEVLQGQINDVKQRIANELINQGGQIGQKDTVEEPSRQTGDNGEGHGETGETVQQDSPVGG